MRTIEFLLREIFLAVIILVCSLTTINFVTNQMFSFQLSVSASCCCEVDRLKN